MRRPAPSLLAALLCGVRPRLSAGPDSATPCPGPRQSLPWAASSRDHLPRTIPAWLSGACRPSAHPRNVSQTSGPRGLQGCDCGGRDRGGLAGEPPALAPACPSARHRRRRDTPGSSSKPPWKRAAPRIPSGVVPLRDPDEQLSYCVKFVTYHQPGRRRVPLPPDRLVELAEWWSRYRFEDFLFAYGARRRGGQLVVDK